MGLADWDKIWHKHMGRVGVGLQNFLPINSPFLFMHNHWDLENHRSDWDDIWHELLERVGKDVYIIKCAIAVFAYLSIFSICP